MRIFKPILLLSIILLISSCGVTNMVNKYDTEFPEKYLQEFLDYTSIDRQTFHDTIDKYRNPNLWEKKSNYWELKHKLP